MYPIDKSHMNQVQPSGCGTARRKILMRSNSIDMTPMVDLGFLLITFFIFTTAMGESRSTRFIMPKDGPGIIVAQSKAFTALLGRSNKVYVYEGTWEDAVNNKQVRTTGYHVYEGLGKLIRQKQQELSVRGVDQSELVFMIKPFPGSSYRNVIDALDEALINGVKKYMVIEPSVPELQYFKMPE